MGGGGAQGATPARGESWADPRFDDWLEFFVRAKSTTVYHSVGTCAMGGEGPLPYSPVCTPELAVRGVSGLRVVDASICPTLVSGNTNAPAIMIGEKGADLIARAHGLRLATSC